MNQYFSTEQGEKVSIIEHTVDQMQKHPGLSIYVGTDSQKAKRKRGAWIATVILYRHGTQGAHYIYFLENIPKMDHPVRLFEEAKRTIECASLIQEHLPAVTFEALEFDYQEVKKTISKPLIKMVKGWVEGLGLTPVFKSGTQYAVKAGNHIVKNKVGKK